jgi:hypothetical protein
MLSSEERVLLSREKNGAVFGIQKMAGSLVSVSLDLPMEEKHARPLNLPVYRRRARSSGVGNPK